MSSSSEVVLWLTGDLRLRGESGFHPPLAEAVGLTGHVTGVDVSSEFLNRGWEIGKDAGLSERISLQEGDIANLPSDNNTFGWAWSADCVGYGPWESLPLLKELVRVVKPSGIVAISAWSSENLLPGYPLGAL